MANKIAKALLEPFDESLIEKNFQGFSYVRPENYRHRILEVLSKGFKFHVTDVVPSKAGLQAQASFAASDGETSYDIAVPVFEEFTFAKEDTAHVKALNIAQTYSMLGSAGLKAVSREMGLGLHLYDKAPTGAATTKAATKAKPAAAVEDEDDEPGSSDGWDGSEIVKYGKFKAGGAEGGVSGMAYNALPDTWLNWAATKPKSKEDPTPNPDPFAVRELARRNGTAVVSAKANVAASAAASDDGSDLPF